MNYLILKLDLLFRILPILKPRLFKLLNQLIPYNFVMVFSLKAEQQSDLLLSPFKESMHKIVTGGSQAYINQ